MMNKAFCGSDQADVGISSPRRHRPCNTPGQLLFGPFDGTRFVTPGRTLASVTKTLHMQLRTCQQCTLLQNFIALHYIHLTSTFLHLCSPRVFKWIPPQLSEARHLRSRISATLEVACASFSTSSASFAWHMPHLPLF